MMVRAALHCEGPAGGVSHREDPWDRTGVGYGAKAVPDCVPNHLTRHSPNRGLGGHTDGEFSDSCHETDTDNSECQSFRSRYRHRGRHGGPGRIPVEASEPVASIGARCIRGATPAAFRIAGRFSSVSAGAPQDAANSGSGSHSAQRFSLIDLNTHAERSSTSRRLESLLRRRRARGDEMRDDF